MHIAASWGGAVVSVEVNEECRSLKALRHAIAAELPELNMKDVCLKIGGCEVDDDAVCSLSDGSVVDVAATRAAQARLALREEGCDVDVAGFRLAAREGNVRQCELYLLGEVAPGSTTLLHFACRSGNVELCKLLIDNGYPVEGKNSWGLTPLYTAAQLGLVELCRLLIERARHPRTAVNARGRHGMTALRTAVEYNRVEVCRLLIANGCKADGWVLHQVVEARSVEMCRLLVDAGFPLDVTDSLDRTPLMVAINAKSDELCRLLVEGGCRVDKGMLSLCETGSGISQLLLDAQRNPRVRTAGGLPPAASTGGAEGETALTGPTSPAPLLPLPPPPARAGQLSSGTAPLPS